MLNISLQLPIDPIVERTVDGETFAFRCQGRRNNSRLEKMHLEIKVLSHVS